MVESCVLGRIKVLDEALEWTEGDEDAGLDAVEDAECIAARIATLRVALVQ